MDSSEAVKKREWIRRAHDDMFIVSMTGGNLSNYMLRKIIINKLKITHFMQWYKKRGDWRFEPSTLLVVN